MDSIPQPTTPAYIGHYHLLEPIGRGGMGLVFRARDTRLEREVAIKCLRTELFESHYIERFKREALLLAKLNHPNIVQIYDFIEAPDQLALVMELVDGQNLQTYLREHIVPMSQRLHWLTQIAEGLAIAHDAGIIHRDLKAENILINKRGQSKITDLGIAKSQDFNATLTDHVAGSYCSMSPEQAMGEDISFKSDLFSLGILAYQLLCGAHPFGDTGNKLQIMQRIISHPPTPPHQHNPDLPAEFVDLLGQLLSKDPNKRPDNTHWVAAQFKKLSAMNVHDNIASDDTQALAMPQPNIARSARTQDHPTFETRFVAVAAPKISLWKKLKDYIAANKIVVGSAALSVLMITGVIVWQLQPKPPKYVAVIPPKLTAEGMQESQQELVKEAVYDAIQQSILQIDSYYLIPRAEVIEIEGSYDEISNATAADELITAQVQCKIEICSIELSRLVPQLNSESKRMIVNKTITIDAIIDNYLSLSEITRGNVGSLFSSEIKNNKNVLNDAEYKTFLEINVQFRTMGPSQDQIIKLEKFSAEAKKHPALQTLFREIALDLYHESNDDFYLKRASTFLEASHEESKAHLYNLYSLQLAQRNYAQAQSTIEKLKRLDYGDAAISELNAHLMMAQGNYALAVDHYRNSISSKENALKQMNLATAYWFLGNTIQAQEALKESLRIYPNHYKSMGLYGSILLIEGNTDAAIKILEKAIQQQPNDSLNINNLGLCYLLTKDYDKAKKLFKKALQIIPKNTTYMLNQADAEYLSGNNLEAERLYRNIIASESHDNIEVIRDKSQAYAHLGKTNDSLTFLRELETRDPQNIETAYTAALVHIRAKNNASALLNIENALEKGLKPIWFNFSWFDELCLNDKFRHIMNTHKNYDRCNGITINQGPAGRIGLIPGSFDS